MWLTCSFCVSANAWLRSDRWVRLSARSAMACSLVFREPRNESSLVPFAGLAVDSSS